MRVPKLPHLFSYATEYPILPSTAADKRQLERAGEVSNQESQALERSREEGPDRTTGDQPDANTLLSRVPVRPVGQAGTHKISDRQCSLLSGLKKSHKRTMQLVAEIKDGRIHRIEQHNPSQSRDDVKKVAAP